VPAGACRIGFGEFEALTLWVILEVHGNQGRHAEATDVFGPDFGAGALGRNHDDGDVVTDLHTFLDDVEAVRVREAGTVLHHRHDRLDDVGVLLVRGEVEHHVGGGQQFLVGADGKAVLGGVLPRLALLGDGLVAKGVRHVEAAVAEVETLVEALGATTDHDHLLAAERLHAVGELVEVHEAALAEFGELCAKRKGVEVVGHGRSPREIERMNATDRRMFRKWTYVQRCVPISATMDG